ncbi:MAG TPA: DNA translocase FtsK 4TM domain-containing protein [Chloroflexota bacterium]|nr:DNA translocase FtsK 4TM domain-containing protein [Chloroflexota bacterium]
MATVKRRPPPAPGEDASPRVRRVTVSGGVLLSAAFVLIVIVLVVPGGSIGGYLRDVLDYWLGWGSYSLPVVVGAFAVGSLRERFSHPYRLRGSERGGWLAVLLAIATILQPVDGNPPAIWGATRGGGLIGQVAWATLVRALGGDGAAVVAGVFGFVALALLLEVGVEDAWRAAIAAIRACGRGLRWLARGPGTVARRILARRERQPVPRLFQHSAWDVGSAALPESPDLAEPAPSETVRVDDAQSSAPVWQLPSIAVLKAGGYGELSQADLQKKVETIEQTLADFDVFARVVQVNPGPTLTQFGLEPGFREKRDRNGKVVKREKIKVAEITNLSNDLALALAAPSIRIEAPVPGRQVVGLEVPNGQASLVSLRQILESTAFQKMRAKTKLAIALGEDVSGQPVAADLARMPHLLIAGATGTGKSVCMNALICCLLLQATPAEVRLILVDPKRVELTTYNDIPHLLRPVVVDTDKVVGVLKWVVHEMDERYKQFEARGVRNIEGFNKLASDKSSVQPLPFIVVVIDELADLMMLAPDETERLLCRLAQLARATGIHLVVATQRPSVDVITGLIKANFPTRISFAVTSQIDSRTILDSVGAEKLLGRGDMLYLPTDAAKPIRLQGVFIDEEVEIIANHWRQFGPASYVEQLVQAPSLDDDEPVDELFDKAAEVAREHTRISTSLLQRRLRIGYTRAARLIDLLEQQGVVGPAEGGGRSREVNQRVMSDEG